VSLASSTTKQVKHRKQVAKSVALENSTTRPVVKFAIFASKARTTTKQANPIAKTIVIFVPATSSRSTKMHAFQTQLAL
jgi:hypothetical protein